MRKASLPYVIIRRLSATPFEGLIAFMAVLTSLASLAGFDFSGPIFNLNSVVQLVWLVSYGISGLLVIVGIASGKAGIEAAGLMWLAGGIVVNLLFLIFARSGLSIGLLIMVAAALSCVARTWTLLRGEDVALINVRHQHIQNDEVDDDEH